MDSDLSEFTALCAKQFCPWCGEPLTRNKNGRPRTFCSDRCRWAFDKYRSRKKAKEIKQHENSRIENDTGQRPETRSIQSEKEAEAWQSGV